MQIFLLWKPSAPDEVERVAGDLLRLFAPLFTEKPECSIRRTRAAALVVLHLPVQGWTRPFAEEDDERWVQAIDYPLDATLALDDDRILLGASRELEQNPSALLPQLSPPFSLLWSAHASDAIHVQNDGLGQAQLFEYDDTRSWALTNRVMALRALGIRLEPVPAEWAAHATLGWFPLQLTGFKNVRLLEPATQLRIDAHGTHRSSIDVLGQWLHPETWPDDEWLEIARTGLLRRLGAAASGWSEAFAGLTGGWDSRAIVSSLRKLGVPFRARVKGQPDSSDVTVARELARIAGIPLQVETSAELPSSDPNDWRDSISLALLWQAGQMDADKQKTLFANGQRLNRGRVNIMGQHGEIGRAFHYAEMMRKHGIRELPWSDAELEARFVGHIVATAPRCLRHDLRDKVHEIILAAYREANRYKLTGLAILDFLYLHENTRRFNAGSLASQTNLVVAPFLNPDFIRAAFAVPAALKTDYALHQHIIATNTPDWADIPYAESQPSSRYYDEDASWQTTGVSLLNDALGEGGFWTEVFDADLAREDAREVADELVMLALLPAG
ncbi:MAG TPA: hypothetical protein VHX14_23715 [Thermoanaerobaculia bacterium]|nr:hypothetical protein [Thermoanaerobaculia bacterium]